jgi:hypothetical protein
MSLEFDNLLRYATDEVGLALESAQRIQQANELFGTSLTQRASEIVVAKQRGPELPVTEAAIISSRIARDFDTLAQCLYDETGTITHHLARSVDLFEDAGRNIRDNDDTRSFRQSLSELRALPGALRFLNVQCYRVEELCKSAAVISAEHAHAQQIAGTAISYFRGQITPSADMIEAIIERYLVY